MAGSSATCEQQPRGPRVVASDASLTAAPSPAPPRGLLGTATAAIAQLRIDTDADIFGRVARRWNSAPDALRQLPYTTPVPPPAGLLSTKTLPPASAPPPTGGWRFIAGVDSAGYDYQGRGPVWPPEQPNLEHVRRTARLADLHHPHAACFNSLGCIKMCLRPEHEWTRNREWHHCRPGGLWVKDPEVPPGWLFMPHCDSAGYTLAHVDVQQHATTASAIRALVEEAAAAGAVAFNTDGQLKHTVCPPSKLDTRFAGSGAGGAGALVGLFVKID